MKALELKVFPTWYDMSRDKHFAKIEGFTINVDYWVSCKRLTDAELAAEYHAQDSKCRHEQWIETVRGDDDYEDWEKAAQSRVHRT